MITTLIIILVNLALLAGGNPIPGRWEKVSATKPGGVITVYTKDGAEQKCRYQFVDGEFLTCADKYNNSIQIEKVSIDKVTLNVRGKHIKQGFLIGILSGVGVAGCILSQTATDYAFVMVPVFAAYGAAAGGLIGAVAPGRETIYISKEAALAK